MKKLTIALFLFAAINSKGEEKTDSFLISKGWIKPSPNNLKIPNGYKPYIFTKQEIETLVVSLRNSTAPSKDVIPLIEKIQDFYNDTTIKVIYK